VGSPARLEAFDLINGLATDPRIRRAPVSSWVSLGGNLGSRARYNERLHLTARSAGRR
jgi:hypothetical protein